MDRGYIHLPLDIKINRAVEIVLDTRFITEGYSPCYPYCSLIFQVLVYSLNTLAGLQPCFTALTYLIKDNRDLYNPIYTNLKR